MAARKTRTLSESWKEKIQTSMLINRLQDHVNGKIELVPSQVTAALGLLKKTAPDLSSVGHGQAEELEPVKLDIGIRPAITREQWLALHKGR